MIPELNDLKFHKRRSRGLTLGDRTMCITLLRDAGLQYRCKHLNKLSERPVLPRTFMGDRFLVLLKSRELMILADSLPRKVITKWVRIAFIPPTAFPRCCKVYQKCVWVFFVNIYCINLDFSPIKYRQYILQIIN